MSRKIAFVSATEKEIEPLLNYLRAHAQEHTFQSFVLHGLVIDILYSGIGTLQTTYMLMDYLSHRHPDGWIQAGIGGTLDDTLAIGNVYQIKHEMISGFGAEDQQGNIMDPFVLGWENPDGFPFSGGLLECPYLAFPSLSLASGITTFYAHGNGANIERLRLGPHGQVENMEGAPFFYVSLIKKIPFLSVRAVSNRVEPRDTGKWEMDLAINNLNETLIGLLEASAYNPDKLISAVNR